MVSMDYSQLLGPGGPTLSGDALIIFIALLVWGLVWKGAALWISARRSEKWWFLVILVVNSFGIIEIIYLLFIAKIRSFHNLMKPENNEQM